MHGVVNRAIECFLRDTYGDASWDDIASAAELGFASFEPMLTYEDRATDRVLAAAEARIGKPRDALLEDLGTYLVSNARYEALRRLLRFSGTTFEDFLLSIDELPGRAHLALPDLGLVPVRATVLSQNRFEVCCGPGWAGFGQVLAGGIRAMADDYGALVTLALRAEGTRGAACIHVTLHAADHSEGRSFDLTVRSA